METTSILEVEDFESHTEEQPSS
ncbi:hypothetical protein L195_g058138, partial [Trifolium pratense]